MLNAKQVLICVVVALVIIGVSMEANAGEQSGGGGKLEYNITCASLAVASEQEDKALYYASLIPEDTSMELFEAIVRSVSVNIYKYAEKQEVSPGVVAGYGFINYGCNRPFI